MTPADAIKADIEEARAWMGAHPGRLVTMSAPMARHLLARAEAFERIREQRHAVATNGLLGERVTRIIDVVEAAEKAGGL